MTPPTTGAPQVDLAGLAVAGVCAAVFLAVGAAHYRGAFRRLVDPWLLSPYTGLALAWLGGGGLLVVASLAVPSTGGATAVLSAVLGLAGIGAWAVGIVGVLWLPARLRPRWLRELLTDPEFLARNGRTRGKGAGR